MIGCMAADNETTTGVVASVQPVPPPETLFVRFGGNGGLRVEQQGLVQSKRVSSVNDSDTSVRLSRELFDQLRSLSASTEPDALSQIAELLTAVSAP